MHPLLLFLFILAIIISYGANVIWLSAILFAILMLDIVGGFVATLIGGTKAVARASVDGAKSEYDEFAAAKTKYPSGKKFLEEGFKALGKGTGKGEKLKEDGKPYKEKFNVANVVGAVEKIGRA